MSWLCQLGALILLAGICFGTSYCAFWVAQERQRHDEEPSLNDAPNPLGDTATHSAQAFRTCPGYLSRPLFGHGLQGNHGSVGCTSREEGASFCPGVVSGWEALTADQRAELYLRLALQAGLSAKSYLLAAGRCSSSMVSPDLPAAADQLLGLLLQVCPPAPEEAQA